MTILLEPDLKSYTDAAFEADLKTLPSQRYEKAMAYRFQADQKRCVRAYMLLREGLREQYGIEDAPVFRFGEHGKPFLCDYPEIHFSLSHTGNAVLCALDTQPVGADIEMIHTRDVTHLLSVFCEIDQEAIRSSACPEVRFTEYWTRKESYLKLTGQGLVGTSALREVPVRDTDAVHFETVVQEADGFVYSLCRWKSSL